MSVPKPPSSLENSCAVLHNRILYTFTPDGQLLSLPIKPGAKWKQLSKGEKVTGAKCVGTESGIYVVGGVSDKKDYAGLQKYSYDSAKWESITPTSMQLQNRQWHGVTYIKAVDSLLIYGGKQDAAAGPSQETFTIQASAPYQASSFDGGIAQLVDPILLPFSDADAMMVGGDPLNKEVLLFNQQTSWRHWTTLADPLPRDTKTMNAIVMSGDDGSKSLLIFDMGATPNQVKRVVLVDASGAPVSNSAPVVSEKRDLTMDDWPDYNSTLAPNNARANFAMAADSDGTVVFAGGNAEDPISIFDAKENSWLDPVEMLGEDEKILAETASQSESATETEKSSSSTRRSSSTVSETGSSTVSETATSSFAESTSSSVDSTSSQFITSSTYLSSTVSTTAESVATDISAGGSLPGSDDSDTGLDSSAILGITLGSIIGFMALLGLLLLWLRRRGRSGNHSEAGHHRAGSGIPPASDEKDSRGFAHGAQPPLSPGYYRGHHPRGSQDSVSSVAILMGRPGQKGAGGKKSQDSVREKSLKNTISKPFVRPEPVIEEQEPPAPRQMASTTRANARMPPPGAADGMRRSSGWNRYWSGGSALQLLGFGGGKRNTNVSEMSSQYSDSPHANSRATQDSATVPPLNFEGRHFEGRASMSRVNTGSPVVSHHTEALPLRQGMSGTIERPVSRASSGFSSGVPESVMEVWDPTAGDRPWGSQRAPSSVYTDAQTNSYYARPPDAHQTGANQAGHPTGVSQQPQLSMASTSDMSWLNLGDQRRI